MRTEDLVVGTLAVLVGLLVCFRGYLAMRVLISIWGAFFGFALGAGLVSGWTDTGLLATVLGWVVAVVLAVVFAAVAYAFYAVSMFLSMVVIGFTLGSTLTGALGVSWSWVVAGVGVLGGLVLGALAIVADLPSVLLSVLTAFAGASTVVFGLFLLFGVLHTGTLSTSTVTAEVQARVATQWWWWLVYVVLAVAGLVAQLRDLEHRRLSLRQQWAGGSAAA